MQCAKLKSYAWPSSNILFSRSIYVYQILTLLCFIHNIYPEGLFPSQQIKSPSTEININTLSTLLCWCSWQKGSIMGYFWKFRLYYQSATRELRVCSTVVCLVYNIVILFIFKAFIPIIHSRFILGCYGNRHFSYPCLDLFCVFVRVMHV